MRCWVVSAQSDLNCLETPRELVASAANPGTVPNVAPALVENIRSVFCIVCIGSLDQFADLISRINNLKDKKKNKLQWNSGRVFARILSFPDANVTSLSLFLFRFAVVSHLCTLGPVRAQLWLYASAIRTANWTSGSNSSAPPYAKAGVSLRRIPFQPLRPSSALCQEAGAKVTNGIGSRNCVVFLPPPHPEFRGVEIAISIRPSGADERLKLL